ncbi:hypothetical protein [Pseudomonas putida]
MYRKVTISDYHVDILPFPFVGYWSDGLCFLRIVVKNNNVIFFCCELPHYTGGKASDAIGNVKEAAIDWLLAASARGEGPEIRVESRLDFWERLLTSPAARKQRVQKTILDYLENNCEIIVHYPSSTEPSDMGVWAMANFMPNGDACWTMLLKEQIYKRLPGFDLEAPAGIDAQWD